MASTIPEKGTLVAAANPHLSGEAAEQARIERQIELEMIANGELDPMNIIEENQGREHGFDMDFGL